jgi:hypothetical protein
MRSCDGAGRGGGEGGGGDHQNLKIRCGTSSSVKDEIISTRNNRIQLPVASLPRLRDREKIKRGVRDTSRKRVGEKDTDRDRDKERDTDRDKDEGPHAHRNGSKVKGVIRLEESHATGGTVKAAHPLLFRMLMSK